MQELFDLLCKCSIKAYLLFVFGFGDTDWKNVTALIKDLLQLPQKY